MDNGIKKAIEVFMECLKTWFVLILKAIANHKNISSLVSISMSNSKMGKVASVSLLPILTCPKRCHDTCGKKCYAKKLALLRPTVRNSYARNTAIAKYAIKAYFQAIEKTMKTVRFFRYHVSGDIPNRKYFAYMVRSARNNPHCEILVFTKQYEIINEWISKNGNLPNNLHILFSGWTNLKPINPYNLPETNVYNDISEINPNWTLCGGNCLNCAIKGCGCWNAKNGETVAFKIH